MNFKKIIFTFSLMLCILLCISCIAAEDVNDTVVAGDVGDVEIASSDDNQVIEQTNDDIIAESGNGNFTELQARILLAPDGSTINLDKNYSYNVNSKITTGVLINKNLVIDGKGHTIDGMSKTRIFTIFYGLENNNNVVLKNIVFKNAYTNGYGGAILSFANLTVDNCTFINNYANIAGGAINSLGGLNLKNSKFDKNVAGGDAGAVFSLNIKYSFKIFKSLNISQNNTYGADSMFPIMMNISLEHCKDYISNCIFTNNVANGNGGGAVYAFSHIDVASSTFNSNKAGEKGAAVFGSKDIYIKDSRFNKNSAGMYGGAVYFKCHEQSGHYDSNGKWVSTVKFYSNLIQNSIFADNVARERGGAIYGFKASASDKIHCAKAVKCTFSDNKAPNGKDVYGGTLSQCVYKNTRIIISAVIVKKSAKRLVLTATLKKGSAPLKLKAVIFKFNGKTYRAKTNSRGIAKYVIKNTILKKLKVGKKVAYSASYGSFVSKRTTIVRK